MTLTVEQCRAQAPACAPATSVPAWPGRPWTCAEARGFAPACDISGSQIIDVSVPSPAAGSAAAPIYTTAVPASGFFGLSTTTLAVGAAGLLAAFLLLRKRR